MRVVTIIILPDTVGRMVSRKPDHKDVVKLEPLRAVERAQTNVRRPFRPFCRPLQLAEFIAI